MTEPATDSISPETRLAALHAALDWADDHAAHTGNNHLPEGAVLSVASKFAQWIATGETPRKPVPGPHEAKVDAVLRDAVLRGVGIATETDQEYTGDLIAGERPPTIPKPSDLARSVMQPARAR